MFSLVETRSERVGNGQAIRWKISRENGCEMTCSSGTNRLAFNKVAYGEVNVIMGFELMTARNKPLIELLYGNKIDEKNKVCQDSCENFLNITECRCRSSWRWCLDNSIYRVHNTDGV